MVNKHTRACLQEICVCLWQKCSVLELNQKLTSVLTGALLIHTHTWDWESPAELRVSGGPQARVCRICVCCPRVSVSQLWVWSEAVRTLDSSLSLYTSAIASRGLHHCVSWRGGRERLRMEIVIRTFNLRETLNIGLFGNLDRYYVCTGYVVHKTNDNNV